MRDKVNNMEEYINEHYISPKKAIEEFSLKGVLTAQQIGWLISMNLVKGFQLDRSSRVHRDDLRMFLHYYYNRKNEDMKAYISENYDCQTKQQLTH